MITGGWIKLDRNILKWRWYLDTKTMALWIYLLLQANYEDRDFRNITVKRGELVASIKRMSEETGLSIQSVRTALSHLEETGEITRYQHGKITVISIPNYERYQDNQQDTNNVSTNDQHFINTDERNIRNKEGKNTRAKRAAPPRESTYMMAVRMQQEAEAELAAEEEDDNE